VRYLHRLLRWRTHRMRLEPIHDVIVEGGEFRSVGRDPEFLLHSSRRRLPTEWVIISYDSKPERWKLTLSLYIDSGKGFSKDRQLPLPWKPGKVQCIVCLPEQVCALRLDPLSSAGRFSLPNLTICEIGVLQVAVIMTWHHLQSTLRHPSQLRRLVQQARMSLKAGGISALKRWFLTRELPASDYQLWIEAYDTLTDADRDAIRQHIDRLAYKPLISVVMPTYNTLEKWLRRAIESVQQQIYSHWELCIADDASSKPSVRRVLEEYQVKDSRIKVVFREQNGHISAASNSALTMGTGEFIALLDHDDELPEHALYMVATELNTHPEADIIYSDEDKIKEWRQRHDPYFKPDWNPDLFHCQNLVSHLGVYRTCRVREVGGFRVGYEGSQDWDLAMRIIEKIPSSHVRHIPHILYHWRAIVGSTALSMEHKIYARKAQRKLLASHFYRVGMAVEILPTETSFWRIKYPLPQPPPLVSLIIPTRDCFDLLYHCVESIYQKTMYPRFELIIVDNQSKDPRTLAYLCQLAKERQVTVLRYDAPFNYSAINNYAVRHACGEVIGLLNNDLEVISPDWLEEMVSHALRPEIGAVGAMLYYPNETIQHAGVILGLGLDGIAGHAYAGKPRGYTGQIGRALLTQTLSAVTAACLVLRRELFQQVDGLDEVHLPVTFNDVDLCLRIRERGYRNLWTPYAELYHHESASRAHEDTPETKARFQAELEYIRQRWGALLLHDPTYNPNLNLDTESFPLAFPPRIQHPWKEEMAVAYQIRKTD
jgi:GT2 family glycosyltransferase